MQFRRSGRISRRWRCRATCSAGTRSERGIARARGGATLAGTTGGEAAIDDIDYLAALEPWAALTPADRQRLAGAVERRDFAAEELLFDAGEMPPGVFVLTAGQVQVADADGTVLSELGPGATLGGRRMLRDAPNPLAARAMGAGSALLVPADLFRDLVRSNEPVRAFFRIEAPARAHPRSLVTTAVAELMSPAPLTLPPGASVRDAASAMREAGVSSVLVVEAGRLVGILTVRDVSSRVAAEGRDPEMPLAEAMTAEPVALPPEALGSDVLHLMMERGISHVPIVAGTRVAGVVSKTDLTRVQAESSGEVIGDAAAAADVEALARVTHRIPALLAQLVGAGNRHEVVTRCITDIADAVTRRLLTLAEAELGPPPVPYLWAACGSQGRQEQTGVSDQDNVLILDDSVTRDDDAWFADLARIVSEGLDRCGYVFCPGEMMATNPRWRKPAREWGRYFRDWIDRPGPEARMLASVMFDLRPIGGRHALFEGLQAQTLEAASRNSIFAAHMTSQALTHQPPLGFWRGLATLRSGEHRDRIDMKHSGVVPVIDLARLYAIRGALRPVNTRARIEAARAAGTVSARGGRDLLDAYDVIAEARLQHQAAQVRAGERPDNFMAPGRLSPFEQSHLRDAFLVVRTMQAAAGQRRGVL